MSNGLHAKSVEAHTLVGTTRRLHGLIGHQEDRRTVVIGLLTVRIGLLTVSIGHLSVSVGPQPVNLTVHTGPRTVLMPVRWMVSSPVKCCLRPDHIGLTTGHHQRERGWYASEPAW